MIALIQRVKHAQVTVSEQIVGQIPHGLLVFLAVEPTDTPQIAQQLLQKIVNYRVFTDQNDKMNLNIQQIQGQMLVVSQFTLAADTQKGNRPSFSRAAPPTQAKELYDYFCEQARQIIPTQTGQFAANMQISLQNDGPVTFYFKQN